MDKYGTNNENTIFFEWNFSNLKAEIEAIDPSDSMAEFDVDALMIAIDESGEDGLITPGETQCLLLLIMEAQGRGRK